jgi:HSP20 family molecular chaperone IbpA
MTPWALPCRAVYRQENGSPRHYRRLSVPVEKIAFYRSVSLPFKPEDGAVEAHLDKGVLHERRQGGSRSVGVC